MVIETRGKFRSTLKQTKQIRDPSVHSHLNMTDLGMDGRRHDGNHRKQRDCAGQGNLRKVYWFEIFPFSVTLWFSQQTCNFFKTLTKKVGINLGHLWHRASPLFPSLVRGHSEVTEVSEGHLPVLFTISCQLHLKSILRESCRHVNWGFS